MGQTLNLKAGSIVLASIRIVNIRCNRVLTPILYEDTVRFVGSERGEIYFEVMNQTAFDLTVDILNTNKDKINKIDLLRPFEKIIIERNEVLGCSMFLEEYITDKGQPLMFKDEKSRCLGEIKIGFYRVFGTSFVWEVDYCWVPYNIQTVVIDGEIRRETDDEKDGCSRTSSRRSQVTGDSRRTETDGCSRKPEVGFDLSNTSRALLKPGRTLEQVRFRETTKTEKFYAYIKFDFGMLAK